MPYTITTDGIIFSRHDTREEAEQALADALNQAKAKAHQLREEADEEEEFAASLQLEETA